MNLKTPTIVTFLYRTEFLMGSRDITIFGDITLPSSWLAGTPAAVAILGGCSAAGFTSALLCTLGPITCWGC